MERFELVSAGVPLGGEGLALRCGSDARSIDDVGEMVAAMPPAGGFQHHALAYGSEAQLREVVSEFVRAGHGAGYPVLVEMEEGFLSKPRGHAAGHDIVEFIDVNDVGGNSARRLGRWVEFAKRHHDRPIRGVSRPFGVGIGSDQLVECALHEHVLNEVFAQHPDFTLLCPFDHRNTEPWAIEARAAHPTHYDADVVIANLSFRPAAWSTLAAAPISQVPRDANLLPLTADVARTVRQVLFEAARGAGLSVERARDTELAAWELCSNALQHGDGRAWLAWWAADRGIVVHVENDGALREPRLGRCPPSAQARRGRGLWLAQQLADLAQLRSSSGRVVVRLSFREA